jgi:dolichol-phosphate mannosyltransferase
LIISVLFLGAVQLVCLGLLGEYVGRIYSMVQQRPMYVIASDSASEAPAAVPIIPDGRGPNVAG